MGTVLVADDSAVARLALARKLRAAAIDVREADCAADASREDPSSIACAVLDLDLGDGDGVSVAAALRAHAPELAIAFFTNGGPDALVARAKEVGPVFLKPDEIDQVVVWAAKLAGP